MTSGQGSAQDGRAGGKGDPLIGPDVHPEGVDVAARGVAHSRIGKNGAV